VRRLASLLIGAMVVGGAAEPGFRSPRIEAAENRCWRKAEEWFPGQTAWRRAKPGGARVEEPRILRRVNPDYPKVASRPTCVHMVHEVLVALSGDVAAVWTVPPEDDEACLEFEKAAAVAMRNSKYTPARAGDHAVPFCVTVGTNIDVR
jgi:hypothetical protein